MGVSPVLAVLGILVSLGFGAWGVFLALRHRYPGEITFVREQIIALFHAIVKDLPDLAVLYRGAPVGPNVVLLRGSFVNTGTKDISPSMTEGSLTLSLPEGSKWLSASVMSCSPHVKASLSVPYPNAIVLASGLLRCKEFIRFQALAELVTPEASAGPSVADSVERQLERSLRFEHRIQDTRRVRSVELGATRRSKEFRREALFGAVMWVTMIVTWGIVRVVVGPPMRFAYDLQVGNAQVVRVFARPTGNASVRVESLQRGFKAAVAVDEFFSRCRGRPVIVPDRSDVYLSLGIVLAFTAAFGVSAALVLRAYLANKRMQRLLALDASGGGQTGA